MMGILSDIVKILSQFKVGIKERASFQVQLTYAENRVSLLIQ